MKSLQEKNLKGLIASPKLLIAKLYTPYAYSAGSATKTSTVLPTKQRCSTNLKDSAGINPVRLGNRTYQVEIR